jgi:cytochrome P450
MLVYWQILYILSTPGLVSRIREEIAPYVVVTKPFSIGSISEAPKLTISHEGLSTKCPLMKSSYLEALRLSDQPWSVRKVSSDMVLSGDKKDTSNPVSFLLKKGEYVTVPHELHMRDPKYFSQPDKFIPDRFIVTKEDGSVTVDAGTIRPYGGGPSICKGRLFAEHECLSLVAGVLAYWDIEPVDKKGWVIPKTLKKSGVSRPEVDTRVRIKRRKFEWE